MEVVLKFTEQLLLGLVKNTDILKVENFSDEDGNYVLEIIVHSDDMPLLIGKSGVNAKAIRTLVQACAYKEGINHIKVNIDSI